MKQIEHITHIAHHTKSNNKLLSVSYSVYVCLVEKIWGDSSDSRNFQLFHKHCRTHVIPQSIPNYYADRVKERREETEKKTKKERRKE